MNTREQEEKKQSEEMFEPFLRMAKRLASLDSLHDIQASTDLARSKDFFNAEKDPEVEGGYNIFIDGEHSHSVKFPGAEDNNMALKAYLEVSEMSFKRGCAFILNDLVDRLTEREINF
jgi:hypothetical protein